MTEVGALDVSGAGSLADLIAPGEGRSGGGKGLREQDWALLNCRITAIYPVFEEPVGCTFCTRARVKPVARKPSDPAQPQAQARLCPVRAGHSRGL